MTPAASRRAYSLDSMVSTRSRSSCVESEQRTPIPPLAGRVDAEGGRVGVMASGVLLKRFPIILEHTPHVSSNWCILEH
jgi:hypothetical protein